MATSYALPLVGSTHIDARLRLGDGQLDVERSVLPGGIRLITQQIPASESTSVGFWFPVGSRDETEMDSGVSHFLEHLLFKGTSTLGALDIARQFDSLGAEWNAATTMEATYYWSHMVDSDMTTILPLLVQMVTDAMLRAEDVDMERGVILDELAMAEDSSQEVVSEHFAKILYGDSPLGRPVGGNPESVRALNRDAIASIYRQRYRPETLIIAAAGSVRHEQLRQMVLDAMETSPWELVEGATPAPRRDADDLTELALADIDVSEEVVRTVTVRRTVEQAHVLVGGPHLPSLDPATPVSAVLFDVLGGGMSSRLFQEVREKRGLAYSTFGYAAAYTGAGHFGMYASCAPGKVRDVEGLLWSELEKIAEFGPTDEEILRAQGQERGALKLGLADPTARMSRLARSELRGRFRSTTAALEWINGVTAKDVQDLALNMLQVPRHRALVTALD